MVAADTTRTKIYLSELIDNNLKPNHILLLLADEGVQLAGQESSESATELIKFIVRADIKYSIATCSDINSNKVIEEISLRPEKVFIFSGFGGVILGEKILSTDKKFLHVHGGYLPEYKGSTTNYFSLIQENMMGASAIFLTKEIDCGPILLRKKFPAPIDRCKLDHEIDSRIRAFVLVECLQNYVSSGTWNFEVKENNGGELFFIIHPVLKHLAIMGGEQYNESNVQK